MRREFLPKPSVTQSIVTLTTLGARPIETMKKTAPEFESLDRCVPSEKPVRLAWLDKHGHIRCLTGRCIDVSSKRVHVEVREQIPLDTRVMLQAGGVSIAFST